MSNVSAFGIKRNLTSCGQPASLHDHADLPRLAWLFATQLVQAPLHQLDQRFWRVDSCGLMPMFVLVVVVVPIHLRPGLSGLQVNSVVLRVLERLFIGRVGFHPVIVRPPVYAAKLSSSRHIAAVGIGG